MREGFLAVGEKTGSRFTPEDEGNGWETIGEHSNIRDENKRKCFSGLFVDISMRYVWFVRRG